MPSSDKTTVKIIENEVYSRVVGYYRPIDQYNHGKKCEALNRKYLKGVKDDGRSGK